MKSYADKKQESQNRFTTVKARNKQGQTSTSRFVDNRPEAVRMRKLQEQLANSTSQVQQMRAMTEVRHKKTEETSALLLHKNSTLSLHPEHSTNLHSDVLQLYVGDMFLKNKILFLKDTENKLDEAVKTLNQDAKTLIGDKSIDIYIYWNDEGTKTGDTTFWIEKNPAKDNDGTSWSMDNMAEYEHVAEDSYTGRYLIRIVVLAKTSYSAQDIISTLIHEYEFHAKPFILKMKDKMLKQEDYGKKSKERELAEHKLLANITNSDLETLIKKYTSNKFFQDQLKIAMQNDIKKEKSKLPKEEPSIETSPFEAKLDLGVFKSIFLKDGKKYGLRHDGVRINIEE